MQQCRDNIFVFWLNAHEIVSQCIARGEVLFHRYGVYELAGNAVRANAPESQVEADRFRFNTGQVPRHGRFETFRDMLVRRWLELDVDTERPADYRCNLDVRTIGCATIANITSAACLTRRTEVQANHGRDQLLIMMLHSGSLVGQQGRVEFSLAPGDAILLDCRAPGFIQSGTDFEATSVLLDRRALQPILSGHSAMLTRRLGENEPELRLFAGYVRGMHAVDIADDTLRRMFGRHIADLTGLMCRPYVESEAISASDGLKAARLHQLLGVIREQATSTDLSAAAAGRAIGISTRYVHQLLERTGHTFHEHLMETRLQRAHELLSDWRAIGMRIGEIAAMAGFADVSHFNRAFRRRFGERPRDVRARATKGEP